MKTYELYDHRATDEQGKDDAVCLVVFYSLEEAKRKAKEYGGGCLWESISKKTGVREFTEISSKFISIIP